MGLLKDLFSQIFGGAKRDIQAEAQTAVNPDENDEEIAATADEQSELSQEEIAETPKSFSGQYYSSVYFGLTENGFVDLLRDRGNHGEFMTCMLLEKNFPMNHIFPNIYIEWAKGKSSEIDLVLLTAQAIFVIENKNYSGTIYGKADYKEWLYYLGGKEYRFYNPVKQNLGHIRSIRSLFPETQELTIVPVVVFSNRCTLKTEIEGVLQRKDLISFIKAFQSAHPERYSSAFLGSIAETLVEHCKQPDLVKEQHIRYVKSLQQRS